MTVDSDTPELLKRLAGSRRQAREIVHLLRFGLQMEMILNGKVPMVGIASEGRTHIESVFRAGGTRTCAGLGTSNPADFPLGGDFAEMTGSDADYFASAPIAYSD